MEITRCATLASQKGVFVHQVSEFTRQRLLVRRHARRLGPGRLGRPLWQEEDDRGGHEHVPNAVQKPVVPLGREEGEYAQAHEAQHKARQVTFEQSRLLGIEPSRLVASSDL